MKATWPLKINYETSSTSVLQFLTSQFSRNPSISLNWRFSVAWSGSIWTWFETTKMGLFLSTIRAVPPTEDMVWKRNTKKLHFLEIFRFLCFFILGIYFIFFWFLGLFSVFLKIQGIFWDWDPRLLFRKSQGLWLFFEGWKFPRERHSCI